MGAWIVPFCFFIASEVYAGYRFNPESLNQIGKNAVQSVDTRLSELVEDEVLQEAHEYFQFDAGVPDDKPGLAKAYRVEQILNAVHQKIEEENPGRILGQDTPWAWNNVGAVFARLKVIYCSPTEYIALFGTQVKQQGYSGNYSMMDVWDIMLTGKMLSHGAHTLFAFPETYLKGDVSLLRRGSSRFYDMEDYTYMIDYGRGFVPGAFFQGAIAPFLRNQDQKSLATQLKSCGKSIIKNLW